MTRDLSQYVFNEYQSSLEELKIDQYPEEIQEQFFDFINTVPYIKNLIAVDRPRAKDLPRDEDGKIVVDLTNPPIIEDIDFFRPVAKHFEQTGKVCNLRPNPNPNSEYGKWVREEVRRCYEGYIRPSDGAWVTGDMYFFLNYCPIMKAKRSSTNSKKGSRVEGFPDFWEGHFLKFHYMHQARENAKHGSELASRGVGKSFTMAALAAKRFLMGESKEASKRVETFIASYRKDYLNDDGILNKFESYIDWCAENTEFPRKRLISSMNNMHWQSGYKENASEAKKGSLNEVIGVSVKDSEGKLRGKRGAFIGLEEFGSFPNLIGLYGTLRPSMEDGDVVFGMIYCQGCVCADTKVWALDGRQLNIQDLKEEDGIIGYTMEGASMQAIGSLIEPSKKHCLEITLSNGNTLKCSKDHPILKQVLHTHRIKKSDKRIREYQEGFVPAYTLKVGDKVCEAREIPVFGKDTLFDARLIGMLIGDGSYGYNNTPKFCSEDSELLDYIKNNYETSLSASHITKTNKVYEEIRVKGVCKNLRDIGVYGQTKLNKELPTNYQTLCYEDTVNLLGGLFDTDGSVVFRKADTKISITQSNEQILKQIQLLLRKLGIISHINKINPRVAENRKDKNPYYTLGIAGRENIYFFNKHIKFLVRHKKENLQKAVQWFENNLSKKPVGYDTLLLKSYKIVNIKDIGVQTIYNLSAICSRTYLANNIITHNTAGDKDSDFAAAQKIMYSPRAFNMYPVQNVYDKVGQGRPEFVFFFPAYINRNGCYNKDGISDVTKALLEILINRYTVKYNSTDLNLITKTISEHPIVPQEAILRSRGNMFPVTQLTERLNELDKNPNGFDSTYIGTLVQNSKGDIEFTPTMDNPIREFPLNDNKYTGALEIYEMPQKDSSGKVFAGRYIMGLDPVNNDQADTLSLTSVFVLDLFTDRIVAEYTGRTDYADDALELVRKLCIFYNAKCLYENNIKGPYAYFSSRRCLHYLADTPEYLRDKQIIKYQGFGNTSKGVAASMPVNNYANGLIREWLIKPVTIVVNEDGQEVEKVVTNMAFVRNRALLQELISYNPDGNFDRIRALGMVMLYRGEFIDKYEGDLSRTRLQEKIEEDSYFKQYDTMKAMFEKH